MGQTVDQIENRIQSSREELRSNLDKLGKKVRATVDWREKFRSNPGAILAVAFGGGFMLARMGGRRIRTQESAAAEGFTSPNARGDHKGQVLGAWDAIQSALVGVVASKVANTLGEVVPGFKEQLAAHESGPIDSTSTAH